jgi:hypothetical protein
VGSDIWDCSAILYFFLNSFLRNFWIVSFTKFQKLKFFGAVLTYIEHFKLWQPSWISPPFYIRKKGHKIFYFSVGPNSILTNKTINSDFLAFASERCFRSKLALIIKQTFFLTSSRCPKSAKTSFFEKKIEIEKFDEKKSSFLGGASRLWRPILLFVTICG